MSVAVVADRAPVLRWTVLVSTLYVVQIGVVIDLQLFGVHPELMLLVAICAGLAAGAARGAEVGFFAGVLSDLVLLGNLGVSALAYAIVGFGAGALADSVIRTSRSISVGLTAAASVAGVLLYALVGQLLGQGTLSDPHLLRIIAIVSLCNAVLCLPVLALSRWAEGAGLRSGIA